jgi:hypothetical protein
MLAPFTAPAHPRQGFKVDLQAKIMGPKEKSVRSSVNTEEPGRVTLT